MRTPAAADPRYALPKHEREQLGKPLWLELSNKVPRVQDDGTLQMPNPADRLDLDQFLLDHPSLPFVTSPSAEMRALALLRAAKSNGKAWRDLHLEVRHCFEAQAAGIEMLLCMPELWAQKALMDQPRYKCKDSAGKVIGFKLPCPGCDTNKYVMVGRVNVNVKSGVRFVFDFGNNKARVFFLHPDTLRCQGPLCSYRFLIRPHSAVFMRTHLYL